MNEQLNRDTLHRALSGGQGERASILKEIRNLLGLTQKAMAHLLRIDSSYLSLLENGKRNIQTDTLEDSLEFLAYRYMKSGVNSIQFSPFVAYEFIEEVVAYVSSRGMIGMGYGEPIQLTNQYTKTKDAISEHSRLIENLKKAFEQNERDEWMLDRVLDSSLSDINSFFRDIDIISPQDLNTTLDRISNSIKKQLTEAYREIRKDSVQLLGYVAGGEPCDSIDLRDMVKLPNDVKADFALRVRGNSMLPSYRDGSIIFVKKQNSLENGQLGVFAIDSINHTFKKYHKEDDRIRLESLNKDYQDIIINKDNGVELTIVGRVL